MSEGVLGNLKEDIWKVTEEDELWGKKWIRYNADGSPVGAIIIVVNGSTELVEAVKKAFYETEGRKH